MDGNHTSHLKRPAADPIAKLEKGGGAVWAQRRGQSHPHLVVKYARRQGGDAVLEGTIPAAALVPDGAVNAADAVLLMDLAVDDLRLFGCQPDSSGIIKCTWVLRSDLDRSEVARTVDQSIAVLARLHGAEPTAYRLVYRSPGEEVAEAGQAGCFFAVPSALVGTLIGGLLTVARGEALPPTEAAIFATVVGFSLGFLVVGSFAPRVLALVPAARAGAGETATWLYLLIPGLVAFATWLLLPRDRAAGRGPAPRDQRRDRRGYYDPAAAIHVPGDLASLSQGLIPGTGRKTRGPDDSAFATLRFGRSSASLGPFF